MVNPAAPASKPELGVRAFIVAVLWIHGRATSEIAKVVDWSPGQVRGFVTREFQPSRDRMTDEERAAKLAEYKADRKDGGRLRDEHFKPIPIMGKPAPRASKSAVLKREWVAALVVAWGIEDADKHAAALASVAAEFRARFEDYLKSMHLPGLDTKDGRRDFRHFEAQVMKSVKEEREQKRLRELGRATSRGISDAALEYLFESHLLRDGRAGRDKLKDPEEQRRFTAGVNLRAYIEGTRLGGLGAFDYERATMGSGSSPSLSISAHKIQCINAVGGIRKMLSDAEFGIVEAVVDQDRFIWEREKAGSRERTLVYEAIRYGLDVVAVYDGLMTAEEFKLRWKEDLPSPQRKTRVDAQHQSSQAEEFFQHARTA